MICENCSNDLTSSNNIINYRCVITTKDLCDGELITDGILLEKDYHFCNINCLYGWLNKYHNGIIEDGAWIYGSGANIKQNAHLIHH